MYLKMIHSVNVGPIEDVRITFPFNEDKIPKPVVIVGENGTGKSILLSNIVDSFHEIASLAFDDATKRDDLGLGHQFYKVISRQEIRMGQDYMYSYIQYESEHLKNKTIEYFFKGGNLSSKKFCDMEGIEKINFQFDENGSTKKVKVESKDAENIFQKNVLCYFPPSRYEKPNWLGNKYYSLEEYEHPTVKEKFSRNLDKQIVVSDMTKGTLQWLLDVIADSRCDVEYIGNNWNIAHISTLNLNLLNIARKNIEKIMSNILGEKVYFGLNNRSAYSSRFNINYANGNIMIPTLGLLSTGQSALFNMFATIVRYADFNDVNKSIRLEDITGIVVIDEIELHLHSNLQRDVLPKLLKLFPKVQFIISSHSPLFLLGMEKEYGSDGYEIYQMPSAMKITAERFSEFEKAYKYLTETETYQQEIKEVIQKHQDKALVITEGKTDWKHIKHALEVFKSQSEFLDVDVHFLEYDDDSLNDSKLETLLKDLAKVPRSNKIIGIFDNDTNIGCRYLEHQCLGNDIYAFSLEDTQGYPEGVVSIELLYPRQELIETFDENHRRIYLSDEFTNKSHRLKKNTSIVCSNNAIVEAQRKGIVKVIDNGVFDDNEQNIALSKSDFAKYVYDNAPSFSKLSIEGFRSIFEKIREILRQ